MDSKLKFSNGNSKLGKNTLMIIRKILDLGPCKDARKWLEKNNSVNAYQLWRKCDRGDWLLWLAIKVDINRKQAVLAACDCAEKAMQYVPEGETRPQRAIEVTRAWCRGEASLEDVRKAVAYAAAETAYAASTAACAAANVAYAANAVEAANAAADAAYASATAAACAAADAAYAADDAAYAAAYAAAAKAKSLKESAQLVRKIPWVVWKKSLKAMQRSSRMVKEARKRKAL